MARLPKATPGSRRISPRMPSGPSEEAFLASYDPTKFERLSVAVDVALLALDPSIGFMSLLVRRDAHPAKGAWSLPCTFVRPRESLDEAAKRVLRDKAETEDVYVEQLYTFGALDRDPRTRVISVAYYALIQRELMLQLVTPPTVDVGRVHEPFAIRIRGSQVELAFDHGEMLQTAILRVRGKLDYSPIGYELLGDRFTLFELQQLHETILGRKLNKDSFRRRMLASGQIEPTGELKERAVVLGGSAPATMELGRPAELYRAAPPPRPG